MWQGMARLIGSHDGLRSPGPGSRSPHRPESPAKQGGPAAETPKPADLPQDAGIGRGSKATDSLQDALARNTPRCRRSRSNTPGTWSNKQGRASCSRSRSRSSSNREFRRLEASGRPQHARRRSTSSKSRPVESQAQRASRDQLASATDNLRELRRRGCTTATAAHSVKESFDGAAQMNTRKHLRTDALGYNKTGKNGNFTTMQLPTSWCSSTSSSSWRPAFDLSNVDGVGISQSMCTSTSR